jgi:hypothetical protein
MTASFHLGLIHRRFIMLDTEGAVKYSKNIYSYFPKAMFHFENVYTLFWQSIMLHTQNTCSYSGLEVSHDKSPFTSLEV